MDETNVNPAQTEALPAHEPPERDFAAEAEALIEARPELRGKPLPDGVLRTALEENQPLLRAFLQHEQRETSAELERLREENRVYRQNAEAAKRSPVSGAAHPGGDDPEADPFLTGFNGSGW